MKTILESLHDRLSNNISSLLTSYDQGEGIPYESRNVTLKSITYSNPEIFTDEYGSHWLRILDENKKYHWQEISIPIPYENNVNELCEKSYVKLNRERKLKRIMNDE